jgi:PHD/YefM family antitoxin component YafN of YafNO toxin-antitoxin module
MKQARQTPEIVLRDGKPAAVILDIDEYQEILERLKDKENLKALQEIRKKSHQSKGPKQLDRWYWSEEGQREMQASLADKKAGRVKRFKDVEALIEELNS